MLKPFLSLILFSFSQFISIPTACAEESNPPIVADRFAIYQGDYAKLAKSLGANESNEVEVLAQHLSRNGVVVLTHVATLAAGSWPNGGDCRDRNYPQIGPLISRIRELNPKVKIFGYVAGTADAPAGSGCGYQSHQGTWNCVGGICRNFIHWTERWRALETTTAGAKIDGIMIDLVSSVWLKPAVRDNIFGYLKKHGLLIMANTPLNSANVEFALNSIYFAQGNYVLIEGFKFSAGADVEAQTRNAIYALKVKWALKKIHLAALATEEGWLEPSEVWCGSVRGRYAYSIFRKNYFKPGDVFAYMTSDLGIRSAKWTQCEY